MCGGAAPRRGKLAERLALEYAGAVPAGRVIAMVHRTNLALAGTTGPARAEILETLVRRLLTDELAARDVVAPVAPSATSAARGRVRRTPRQRSGQTRDEQDH